MPETPRLYRLVHYAADGQVLTRIVQLAWSWHWRYGRDPATECTRAHEAGATLDDRATEMTHEINEEIATGLPRAGGRLRLLGMDDLLGSSDRDLIRRDLLAVEVAIAMLSALAAKAAAAEARRNRQ